jgi:hypothetical protein
MLIIPCHREDMNVVEFQLMKEDGDMYYGAILVGTTV